MVLRITNTSSELVSREVKLGIISLARRTLVGVAAAAPNTVAKLPLHIVTGRACARPAPTWPATYDQRWASEKPNGDEELE